MAGGAAGWVKKNAGSFCSANFLDSKRGCCKLCDVKPNLKGALAAFLIVEILAAHIFWLGDWHRGNEAGIWLYVFAHAIAGVVSAFVYTNPPSFR